MAHTQTASSASANPDICAVSSVTLTSVWPPFNNIHLTHISQFEPTSQVSDACASYADLEQLNHQLQPLIHNLVNNTDFFSYYRLNLYNKRCPFWNDENGMCGNIACAVTTLENEEDIPPIWRAEELSKLEGPKAQHPGRKQQKERDRPLLDQLGRDVGESCVVEYDDECDERDYCVPEDEGATGKGDYVSLTQNPERYTGYAGEGAKQVWEAIYRENCFSRPRVADAHIPYAGKLPLSPASGSFSPNQAQAAQDFRQVLRAHDRQQALESGRPEDALELDDDCLEKRVFYRVISGMHASISTHLCYDFLNQSTGEWGPNLQCYYERLHRYPERISNLYFNYALLLRAVGKLRDHIDAYTFCTGDPVQDRKTRDMLSSLAAAIPAGPRIFDESVMFTDHSAAPVSGSAGLSLKEDFRNRFRNVSRIMDCVGCDKCRLWGKLQTNGFGTALKVLFEYGNGYDAKGAGEMHVDKPVLRRTELVALINTLDKISTALRAIEHFRDMLAAAESDKSAASHAYRHDSDEADDYPCVDNDSCLPNVSRNEEDESLGDIFRQEFGLLLRAVKYVLLQWIETPRKIGIIIYVEFMRLTEFWLGWPVRERSWNFHFPTRDEL